MKAYLLLENSMIFEGERIGSPKDALCEVVFNTSMTGYLEVLTDPSYAAQAVVMTYPLIGNYGVAFEDREALKPAAAGFIVRELAKYAGGCRNQMSLSEYLELNDIPGIQGIDTRELTIMLREKGVMNGKICSALPESPEKLKTALEEIRAWKPGNVVAKVTCDSPTRLENPGGLKVALMDYGAKANIARSLQKHGFDVTVFPAATPAEKILSSGFDGVMLSNGPGDPKEYTDMVREVKKMMDGGMCIFGICLGHQLLALAAGADTTKLKYGHRGGNQPVKDLKTGRVYITSQNHGYVVKGETLPPETAEVSHININDDTIEGLDFVNGRIFSVQFHPEACPGPRDSEFLFGRFKKLMEENKHA